MSKMNESDDDLNLRDLRSKFPQIKDYRKIDSKDGTGISVLKEKIRETAWSLPLMRTPWVDSWYRVRKKLEGLRESWITYNEFYNICVLEGLDDTNISILDGYLHELGVTLHFKNRLENTVILKPEWATDAFYNILSARSVLHREGRLLYSELHQIWDREIYPSNIYPQLMDLMNKFELAYELPDKESYLVPELLPKSAPYFIWDEKDNLCFYYCYDYFLPPGIITRFIVRMHQEIEKKENGLPLCWREGVVLKLRNSIALVEVKPDKRQIEIRIKGDNKRGTLEVIRYHFDRINASIKKIKVSTEVPCNCSENCPGRYPYEKLLKAEMNSVETIRCLESFKPISISLLLDGYRRNEEDLRESKITGNSFEHDVFICHSSKDKPIIEALIEDLKKEKITYWVDAEQINFGDQITQKIEEGIKNSKYIIPCLSKNLNTSGWTKAEYGAILNAEFRGNSERIVIPLKLDNCEENDIPLLLRDRKRVTYSNKTEFDEFTEFLVRQKSC